MRHKRAVSVSASFFFPGLDSRLCTLRPGKYARHRGMSKEQLLIGALADVQEERLKEPFRQDREE